MSQTPTAAAPTFVDIDVHDDTMESVAFEPASTKRSAIVRVVLFRHWEARRRVLEFLECSNVQFIADADVLRDNLPSNTSHVKLQLEPAVSRIMKRHKAVWGVGYSPRLDPLPGKLKAAGRFAVYRLQFFGGRLEVVAKGYRMRHLTTRSSGP